MNWLQAQMFQFHFTRYVYKYETCNRTTLDNIQPFPMRIELVNSPKVMFTLGEFVGTFPEEI